jgi:hypothetical protein
MHHVDVTPSAADVARPSAPSDVTVAWRLGLVAFGLTTAVLAALVASATLLSPQTTTATPGAHPRTAGRPSRAGNQIRVDTHHRPARVDHRTHPLDPHPRHRAAGRQQADHHSWTGQAQAPATAGTGTITEALLTLGPSTIQPPVTTPTTTTASPTHDRAHHDRAPPPPPPPPPLPTTTGPATP